MTALINDEKRVVCNLFEVQYIQAHGYETAEFSKCFRELFPREWLDSEDYDNKIRVLAEALEKSILIIETDIYQQIMSGKIL